MRKSFTSNNSRKSHERYRASQYYVIPKKSATQLVTIFQWKKSQHPSLAGDLLRRSSTAPDAEIVPTIKGEVPIEEVILPEDRNRLAFLLYYKDQARFFQEERIYLDIKLRNWAALHGHEVRFWKIPTTIRTFLQEHGLIQGIFEGPAWYQNYKSYCPGTYQWDLAVPNDTELEKYNKMRKEVKPPKYYTWSSMYQEKREIMRHHKWKKYLYKDSPYRDDFDVYVEWIAGQDQNLPEGVLANPTCPCSSFRFRLPTKESFKRWLNRKIWGKIEIYHFQGKPGKGNLYEHTYQPEFYALHEKYPSISRVINSHPEPPIEWQVHLKEIVQSELIDPDFDTVHAYQNFDARGSKSAKMFEGHQYVVAPRRQECFHFSSGAWWYYPRNYRYEMQRGIEPHTDTHSRKKDPLYERMISWSMVNPSSDQRPPWRRGAFQNLGWFMQQWQYHIVPFMRRVKVSLDLLTLPFARNETPLSRLEGTLYVLSRAGRIVNSKGAEMSRIERLEFLAQIKQEVDDLEKGMEEFLASFKKMKEQFLLIYDRLKYAAKVLNTSRNHWRLLVGRNQMIGSMRLDFSVGFNWFFGFNTPFKDRYYGTFGLYGKSRFRRPWNPYNNQKLEDYPLSYTEEENKRKSTDSETKVSSDEQDQEGDPSIGNRPSKVSQRSQKKKKKTVRFPAKDTTLLPGTEIPEKPIFVPFDLNESSERIPLNFFYFTDKNCHLHLPLEQERCVSVKSLKAQQKSSLVSHLFTNAIDILTVSKKHLTDASSLLTKGAETTGKVYMTPTGPIGPKDEGYEDLLKVLLDPSVSHPYDTAPLESFDSLLPEFYNIVNEASYRVYRHMLGPGAYRLSQSLQQIFDLYEESHLMFPHLERLEKHLKQDLKRVKHLSACESKLSAFTSSGSLSEVFRPTAMKTFRVLRFSVPVKENKKICSWITPDLPDTFSEVQKKLRSWVYLRNMTFQGYKSMSKYKRNLDRRRTQESRDRHAIRFSGISFETGKLATAEFDETDQICDPERRRNVAPRRGRSRDKHYLADDRILLYDKIHGLEQKFKGTGSGKKEEKKE